MMPGAFSIPIGKAFIASAYGVALYLDKHSMIGFNGSFGQHFTSQTGSHLSVTVRTCRLRTFKEHMDSSCNVTLAARFLGPEVCVGTSELVHTSLNNCAWNVQFPPITTAGSYKLELITMWDNEMEEPTAKDRNAIKADRINGGRSVNLGGMGLYYPQIHNVSNYNLDGYVVRGHTKDTCLLKNGTRHPFGSWAVFMAFGLDSENITKVCDAVLNLWPVGDALTVANVSQKESLLARLYYPNLDAAVTQLCEQRMLMYDSFARLQASVFGLPSHISFTHPPQQPPRAVQSRYFCSSPSAPGRWTVDPACLQFLLTSDHPFNDKGQWVESENTGRLSACSSWFPSLSI